MPGAKDLASMTAGPAFTVLTLPYESMKTLWRLVSEVRLYRNEITNVLKIGKRVSALACEETVVFREARVLQSIKSDYIVPVHDVARVDDPDIGPDVKLIEMVMPYYPQGSVCDALVSRGERFSVGDAVRIVRDALFGLAELHEQHNLLHGDVKSGNVFLDGDRARIGDLGMTVPLEADGTAVPQQASQPSTPPETVITNRQSRRSDIYGAGLVLHELLNGPLPYAEYGADVIASRLAKGKRAILNEHLGQQAHVPPRIRTIINKAMARDPSERYATAHEMIDALNRAPFIDWRPVDDLTWEGEVPGEPGVRYQVKATKVRRPDRWRLSARKLISNDWRRCGIDDQDVADLSGKDARAFFDQLVAHATSR
jgi:serine/threonine protein kinase